MEFQLIDVKFTEGMDTKSNKKLVIPAKWSLLRDCTQSGDGTLQKRDGRVSLIRDSSAFGNGLATFNSELLAINGSKVRSISVPTLTPASVPASAIVVSGQLGFVEVRAEKLDISAEVPLGADVAHGAGFTCYVWTAYTAVGGGGALIGTYCLVVDESTGTRVLNKTLVNATARYSRVVFSVNAFFIFYVNAGNLWCIVARVVSGVLTLGVEVSLVASASIVVAAFDACEFITTSTVPGVGVSYRFGLVDSVRAIGVTHTAGVPALSFGPVSVTTIVEIAFADIGGVGVCVINGVNFGTFVFARAGAGTISGTVAKMHTTSFVSASAATQIDTATPAGGECHITATGLGSLAFPVGMCFTDQQGSIGAAAAIVLIRQSVFRFSAGVISVIISGSAIHSSAVGPTAGGPTVLAPPRGPFIVGKPVVLKDWDSNGLGALVVGAVLLPVVVIEGHDATATNTSNLQPTVFVMDGVTGAMLGKALYGTYGVGGTPLGVLDIYSPCSTPLVGVASRTNFSTWGLVVGERGTLQFNRGINTTQHGVTRLTLNPQALLPPIRTQLGPAAYLAGGSLTQYDSISLTEVGFPLFPEGISAVVAAGGALPVGTYQAVAIYEWADGQGQRHQSSPSLPVSFSTTAGNQSVTVTAPTLLITQKTGVTVVLFVTQAAGTIFNRVTPISTPVMNTKAAVSVAFPALNGGSSITGVAGNEALYTQPLQAGTTLPNDAPGPTSALAQHQGRLFVDATDAIGVFRYSQGVVAGVGLQWSSTLSGVVPREGGKIVGFASMDEKLIIFCENKPYVVLGTGPNASGAFSNYSDPIEISSDVGCSEARSILKLPSGVMFKSAKGWYLLGRDLQTRYIGDGVASYDAHTVFSAAHLKDKQEVRISVGSSTRFGVAVTSETGTTLVYSYLDDSWSTSVYNVTPAAGDAYIFVGYDTVWWDALGVFMSISLFDGVNRDTPGVYVDSPGQGFASATPIIMLARTSFLHLGTLEGYQRVRWLYLTATYPSGTTANIGVKFTVDYDDVYAASPIPGAPGSYTTSGQQALATYGQGLTIDFRHKLRRQKCKSVAFTFENLDTVASMAVITGLQALALEVGVKKGTNKLSSAQSVA